MEELICLGLIESYLRNSGSHGPVPVRILEELEKTNHGIGKGSSFILQNRAGPSQKEN